MAVMKLIKRLIIPKMILIVFISITSFAGWEKDNIGWWYKHQDGSYTKSNWEQINGKYYYFDNNGYMLHDTKTPDGYMVGADGVWIESIVPSKTSKSKEEAEESITYLTSTSGNNHIVRPEEIVTNKYYGPGKEEKEEDKKSSRKNKKNSSKSKSKYETIYNAYKERIETSDGDVDSVSEIYVEGLEKMAGICVDNKLNDYNTYKKWGVKLQDAATDKAGGELSKKYDVSEYVN